MVWWCLMDVSPLRHTLCICSRALVSTTNACDELRRCATLSAHALARCAPLSRRLRTTASHEPSAAWRACCERNAEGHPSAAAAPVLVQTGDGLPTVSASHSEYPSSPEVVASLVMYVSRNY